MHDLRYPIGKFSYAAPPDDEQKRTFIDEIAQTPANLRACVKGLSEEQLDTPYRPGGWTVRQVIHHVPDSHLNAYVRFKLALTEEEPTIKTYAEDRWAELADSKSAPTEVSLTMLDSLHDRWVRLLHSHNSRRMEANVSPSGSRPDDTGKDAGAVFLARAASRGAYH